MATAGIQTKYGKSFEYACVISLYDDLSHKQEVAIEESPQLLSAKNDFQSVEEDMKESLLKAADAACRVIKRLEPQLQIRNSLKCFFISIFKEVITMINVAEITSTKGAEQAQKQMEQAKNRMALEKKKANEER